MQTFAESKSFIVSGDYETAYLGFKNRKDRGREVVIGDFYGDLQTAAIAPDESFCVMAGCGLIVYYLKEPFEEYTYEAKTTQWKEFFREFDDVMWIDNVEIVDNATLVFTTAETDRDNKYRFNIDSAGLTKVDRRGRAK